jgi:hypothetical protein
MARNLLRAYRRIKPSVLVVLAGNIHSALVKGTAWSPEFRTMGYEILSRKGSPFTVNNSVAIKQRYLGGSAWVCLSGKPCEVTAFADFPTTYSKAVPLLSYFLADEKMYEGYSATYFVRRLTPSVPLNCRRPR